MNEIIFFQMFEHETSTYTYIIADKESREAAIIDPVKPTVERDLKLIAEAELKLKYILDTHIHADHITGAGDIRRITGAKTALSHLATVDCCDLKLSDNEELKLGNKTIKAITTPGHTDSCISYLFEGMIFSGDALLIRGCGRTDFQQGSPEKLFHSVREKLFSLPNETIVYPGHDYRGFTSSTIALEKKHNSRLSLNKSLEDFKKIMSELKLPYPKKLDESLPANLKCGFIQSDKYLNIVVADGLPEVTCEDVYKNSKKIRMIDVRNPDEFNAELGHIDGAELVTLGDNLSEFLKSIDKNQVIVFICRSGGRSGRATLESIELGFKNTANMIGGMIKWNDLKLPVKYK